MIRITSNDSSKRHFLCSNLAIFIIAQVMLLNLASATVNNVPIFKVISHDYELIEPSIEIINKKFYGYNRIQWSASFPSYHTAVIKNINYKVHASCQCSDTNVSSVSFFFTPFGQEGAKEQKLQLNSLSTSLSAWPTYGSTTVESETSFNKVNGAIVVLRYYKQSIDMSGSIRCELETASGIVLKSNRLDIFDVKEYVVKLWGISQVGSSTTVFPRTGLGSFEPVPDQMKEHLKKLLKYVQLDVYWSLATEDRSFKKFHMYDAESPPTFFKQSRMQSNSIGQYYINKNLKLFVNMASPLGVKLRNKIENFGEYRNDVREVLMLQDTTATIAIKFHAKSEDSLELPQINQKKLPIRVEPELDMETISTYTGNSDNRMACGFIVDNAATQNLRIEWEKDNVVLSPKQIFDKYGVKTSDSIGNGVLHLNGVNVDANGVWKCSLKSPERNFPQSLSGIYQLKVTRFPGFGDFKSNYYVGTPPKLVYAMEGATINISCMVTSYDKDGNSAKPNFFVNNVRLTQLCCASIPNKNALCEIYNRISIVDIDVPQVGSSIKYMNKANYIIKDIPYKSQATGKKFNHVVSCSASGSYLIADKVSVVTTQASTSINIIPRLTKASFVNTPIRCNRGKKDDVGICSAQKDNVFSCELSVDYVTLLNTAGVTFKKYWRIGQWHQSAIEMLDDSAVLKKHVKFNSDGNTLTVKSIQSERDRKIMNTLSNIRCVVELYYPNYVGYSNLSNLQITDDGNGMLDPAVESLQLMDTPLFNKAPMFYTSEKDKQADFLVVPVAFETKTHSFV